MSYMKSSVKILGEISTEFLNKVVTWVLHYGHLSCMSVHTHTHRSFTAGCGKPFCSLPPFSSELVFYLLRSLTM